jgi:site-specific recombinase XerD
LALLDNENEIDGDEAYFNFINSIKSESTKTLYENNLKLFMKFCNVSDLKDLLKIDAQRYIIRYVMSLREMKLASNSIKSRLNPVSDFYEMNDVSLNKKKIGMFKGEFIK